MSSTGTGSTGRTVLRIHFTTADLSRFRISSRPHPLWEIVSSIRHLHDPQPAARHRPWLETVYTATRRHTADARSVRSAAALVPRSGRIPEFLTVSAASPEPQAYFDTLRSLSKQTVREDLERTFRGQPRPSWAMDTYERGHLNTIADVLRRYYRLAVEPFWPEIERQVEAGRAEYAADLLDHGADTVLQRLFPSFAWRNPDLIAEAADGPVIELGGRGLLAQPVYFCPDSPFACTSLGAAPTLACPPGGDLRAHVERSDEDWSVRLGRLLGLTRARVLTDLVVARTTTELATRLAVSQGTISQHTKILRDAGLLTTCRLGNSVRHALTPQGRILIKR